MSDFKARMHQVQFLLTVLPVVFKALIVPFLPYP